MAFEPFPNARDGTLVGVWRRMRPVKDPHLAEQEHADRDPSRSLTSAPNATNNASMSAHLMEPLAGREKINARVAR
jgi:hypothetical protein